jgi:3(or 17)beta-hydroxysteroid dehydrogenase
VRDLNRLDGKVAIVTGGAKGIGLAISKRFHEEGALVIVADVDSTGQDSVSQVGARFITHDVTDEQSWRALIAEVVNLHGRLDILANNAGIALATGPADPEGSLIEDWRRLCAVNVEGVFLGCKTSLPAIAQAGGGAIVNTASVAAHVPLPFDVAYGAGKAAVVHMTRSVALYCAKKGYAIRCNSVSPGTTRTSMLERRWAAHAQTSGADIQDIVDEDLAGIPLGHFLEPVDIANAVLFLASDEARYITGLDIRVDGGIELAM